MENGLLSGLRLLKRPSWSVLSLNAMLASMVHATALGWGWEGHVDACDRVAARGHFDVCGSCCQLVAMLISVVSVAT